VADRKGEREAEVKDYEVEIEFGIPASPEVGEAIVDAFASLGGVAGVSDHGNADVMASVRAPTMTEATIAVLEIAEKAGVGRVVCLQVMPAHEWAARQGFLSRGEPEVISVTEVAGILGVSRQRVHQLIASGRIPSHRVGHSHVIERSDIVEYAKGRAIAPSSA
jgi:excisionase family DNA binding protein